MPGLTKNKLINTILIVVTLAVIFGGVTILYGKEQGLFKKLEFDREQEEQTI